MRKRVKDLAYTLKIDKKKLLEISSLLTLNEKGFYRNWDEPKTDEKGNPRIENGIPLTRPINAPVKELKDIQSKILHRVLYKLQLPGYFFGGLKGKDAVLNGRYHQGNKYFFLTDLKNFFPSVLSQNVEKALRKEGFYPDVARLITRLCTKENGIPQGCPTSSFLASLVVYHSCGDLFQQYKKDGLKISVYVDDITISSPVDFKEKTSGILNDLRARGLKVNFKKTHYCSKNPVVTGIQVKNNGIVPMPHTFDLAKNMTISDASRKGHIHRINYVKKIADKKNTQL